MPSCLSRYFIILQYTFEFTEKRLVGTDMEAYLSVLSPELDFEDVRLHIITVTATVREFAITN